MARHPPPVDRLGPGIAKGAGLIRPRRRPPPPPQAKNHRDATSTPRGKEGNFLPAIRGKMEGEGIGFAACLGGNRRLACARRRRARGASGSPGDASDRLARRVGLVAWFRSEEERRPRRSRDADGWPRGRRREANGPGSVGYWVPLGSLSAHQGRLEARPNVSEKPIYN